MAEADPIRRIKDAARRAAEPPSVDTQRRWYLETLEQDLAPSAEALNRHMKIAQRGRRLGILGWTVIILLITSITVAGLFVRQMWLDGALEHLMDSPFAAKTEDGRWMVGKQGAAGPAEVQSPEAAPANEAPPSLVEPITAPSPPAAPAVNRGDEDAPEEEAGATEQ
jgi:hypothetical protein